MSFTETDFENRTNDGFGDSVFTKMIKAVFESRHVRYLSNNWLIDSLKCFGPCQNLHSAINRLDPSEEFFNRMSVFPP